MAKSEAPESAKAAGNSYPLCLPPLRQSSTLYESGRYPYGHGMAQGWHQPIGRGVQDQPELVGERALSGSSVEASSTLRRLTKFSAWPQAAGNKRKRSITDSVWTSGAGLRRPRMAACQRFGRTKPALGLVQQNQASVQGDQSALEIGGHLFASRGWQCEREQSIFGHGALVVW